ncbi:helicase-related protein [Micromonospora sp. NBC_00860]|uniref:helicase-related protein n=1 Tax=Micromonospora sp. NBC_00860 TaxID=2975980 RepID=UPI00386E02FA|nr:helicase-related protein [Micromonospora sp. NBC_00860]
MEDLTPGSIVSGVTAAGSVVVVAAKWYGSNAVNVTYRDESGQVADQLLYRDNEARLRVQKVSSAYGFDGDGALFKLAAEALRIQMAARFDPMLAVTTSDLEPLPHQIQAVYGDLLDRSPLRFVLADDPGAGKTIMAGLYIKELMLRGDLERCLIVAPGGLIDQWQEELLDKFGLRFEVLTRDLIASQIDQSVFDKFPLLIGRMDQLARSEELQEQLTRSDWDVIVVDEAHRMSASYFGDELKKTKRYVLGELLGKHTRHLLLMTATPHAGNEASFQLFMGLLDSDRFEGRYRDGVSSTDTDGLMRRMVKEDLLTFEGKPLFPERRAYTVPYQLSEPEWELYEVVTEYVREQMGKAQQLAERGESRRGNTVGFALTVLQRRLASSPEAILQSLVRRHRRLQLLRQELIVNGAPDGGLRDRLAGILGRGPVDYDAALEDMPGAEREALEDDVVNAATTAQTIAELDKEIAILADLVEVARRVRDLGTDKKWTELSELLLSHPMIRDSDGTPRKLIVFTEHRDTLEYLVGRIRALLGSEEAVVSIHGGVSRDNRRKIKELFTQDKDCRILVATDAAGEGLNLQRANLMVNYDLPWNPNRIEQRFGRIHRIGQTEVCHLWNLVAEDTREGAVFIRLLHKIDEQRRAYKGKVFDVLGEAFQDQPLRGLLMQAIQYGDRPEVRDRLNKVIDASVGEGLEKLLAERALAHQKLAESDVATWRLRMEEARARRLQPHYIKAFFIAAFKLLGGRISEREPSRYEITYVPGDVLGYERLIKIGTPVLRRYERVTFDRDLVRPAGVAQADLVAPGHPLLDTVVALIVERYGTQLKQGAVLVNRRDVGEEPHLLVAVAQEIADGHERPRTISKRFDFVEIGEFHARAAGSAPYLDYAPASEEERRLVAAVTQQDWLASGVEDIAISWAISDGLAAHVAEIQQRVSIETERTRRLVRQRLLQEINYWDSRQADIRDAEAAGKSVKIKSEIAARRARDLEQRLERRMVELDCAERLQIRPPRVAGAALVIPQGLLDRLAGSRDGPPEVYARDTALVERRAVDLVLQEERKLGRIPEEMAHNNPGYDVRSSTVDDRWVFIEVKGRTAGAEDFHVTRTEVLTGKNSGTSFRLALVSVHPDGSERDEVRYVVDPFKDVDFGSFDATELGGDWAKTWRRGGEPV